MTERRLETRLHPDDRIDPGKAGPQVMRYVIVNVAESPIAWLASRGHLTDAQLRAGERLRADYERAGLSARVTMRWDAAPPRRAAAARVRAMRRWHGSTRIGVFMVRSMRRVQGWPISAGG